MRGKTGCLIAVGVLVLVGLIAGMSLAGRYNGLVVANEQVDAAWAQVQNVLQRRADLVPNLVETVKGYAVHEREIFVSVAEARSRLAGAATPAEAAAANAALTSALSRLLAIVENYPELKANQNFIQLQDELAGTENRIAVERMRYNDVVLAFNSSLKRFPNNLVAGLFGFREREYFEAGAEAQQAPKVQF